MAEDEFVFKTVPAGKLSLSMRRLIYGVGVNDSPYTIVLKINGKRIECPYYRAWFGMLRRCYSKQYRKTHPTYAGCSVCGEWLLFSNFRAWMVRQNWKGKELDKDIMCPGNKIYSPQTCVFVNGSINTLLTNSAASRGDHPQGVKLEKRTGRFIARININGKYKHLGSFGSSEKAYSMYRETKRMHILTIACCEKDVRVKQGLYRHSELLK